MKIFITGISGLLGANLAKSFSKDAEIMGCYVGNAIDFKDPRIKAVELNVLDFEKSSKVVSEFSPDIIVHTAAMVNVDYAESHKDEAYEMNVKMTENVVKMASKLGSKIIYISSDSIFDGKKGDYSETDTVNPLSVYAQTKFQGEETVRGYDNHIVIRTVIHGLNAQDKKSFSEWILSNLKSGTPFNGFNDTYFTPILVNRIANAIEHLCAIDFKGTINIASTDRLSKYDFACLIADVFGYDKKLITSIQSDGKWIAPRPKDPSLNVEFAKTLGVKLQTAKEDIIEMKRLMENGYYEELKRCVNGSN